MWAPLPPRRFQPMRAAVLRLVEAGDCRGALPLALEAQAAFPAHGEVPFWLACIHCRLGDSAAALAALRAGLARGHYWPGDWLLGDDDMAPLRGSLELKAVVRESERARAAAARPGVLRPVGLDPPGPPGPPGGVAETAASPRAVVVALHGWGQDAEEFALHWQAAVENGFRVLVPRSSQQPTPGFFVWDDRETARADVTAQLRSAPGSGQRRTSADRVPPLLTAGFSQGGGLAVDLAIDADPVTSVGFLAVAAGAEDLAALPDRDRLVAAAARGLRGRLLVGDRDDALAGAGALSDAAVGAGLACSLTIRPGAGHEMPEPPGRLLVDELIALLARVGTEPA